MPGRRRASANRLKELRPAPGELRQVQAFLNSTDFEAGTDELASPRGLAEWLERHALLPTGVMLDTEGVARAAEFRERLRAMIAAGEAGSPELAAAVTRACGSAFLRATFGAGGMFRPAPAADGLDGAIGRILASIAMAQRDGLWPRFKVCVSGTCRASFYDYSANRSGLWCLPRCGTRIRGREYRQRRRHLGLR
ncbi:MAG: hypothetical protein GY719_27060 [bacterium]|nr:hypothetical protein [bacterium]